MAGWDRPAADQSTASASSASRNSRDGSPRATVKPRRPKVGGPARPIRIGALAPLSAPGWTDAGRHLVAGIEQACIDVNRAGGVGGRPVELLVRDTAADPATAKAVVEELTAEGVVALVGEFHSVTAQVVAARAITLDLPFICSSAVIDALTDQPSELVARIAPPQSTGWSFFAAHLEAVGCARIAVATQPSPYWRAGTRILRQVLERLGGSVVEIDVSTSGNDDLCDKLAGNDVSALLLLMGMPEPACAVVRVRTH